MAILNKLTPQKFKTLMEQFLALNIDTPERLEGVIDRIFEKVLLLCNQRMSIPESCSGARACYLSTCLLSDFVIF
jgi:hypothetical protein